MIQDLRAPFLMTEEELKEEDALRIEKLYYVPVGVDVSKVYRASDYEDGNLDAAAEKTKTLEEQSILLWDVENGAAEIPGEEGTGFLDLENTAEEPAH